MTTNPDPYAPRPKASQEVARAKLERQHAAPEADARTADADPGLYQIAAGVVGLLAVLGIFALAFSQFSNSGPLQLPAAATTRAVFAAPVVPTSTPEPYPTPAPTPTALPQAVPAGAPIRHEPAVQQADWTQIEPEAPAETGEKPAPDRTTQRATAIARSAR